MRDKGGHDGSEWESGTIHRLNISDRVLRLYGQRWEHGEVGDVRRYSKCKWIGNRVE